MSEHEMEMDFIMSRAESEMDRYEAQRERLEYELTQTRGLCYLPMPSWVKLYLQDGIVESLKEIIEDGHPENMYPHQYKHLKKAIAILELLEDPKNTSDPTPKEES